MALSTMGVLYTLNTIAEGDFNIRASVTYVAEILQLIEAKGVNFTSVTVGQLGVCYHSVRSREGLSETGQIQIGGKEELKMETPGLLVFAANVILVTHVLFVGFVVLGLLLVFAGGVLGWQWVRNPWFRVLHLLGIAVVVLQSWFGVICPLTIWEQALRAKAGVTVYEGSFIIHWLSELLFFNAAPWVFMLAYTVFGALVLSSWFVVKPRTFHSFGSGRLGSE